MAKPIAGTPFKRQLYSSLCGPISTFATSLKRTIPVASSRKIKSLKSFSVVKRPNALMVSSVLVP